MKKKHRPGILGYGQLIIGTDVHEVAIEKITCSADGKRKHYTVMEVPSVEQDIHDRLMDAVLYGYTTETKNEAQWVPCSVRLPDEYGDYLISVDGDVGIGHYGGAWSSDDFYTVKNIQAWMPLPEPYKEKAERKEE